MAKENGMEMYGSETDLPITRDGILKSFPIYQKLCEDGTLNLDSRLTRKQVHRLLEEGALLKDDSNAKTSSLAEIILEQVEGYEWIRGDYFPEGVLRKYGWTRNMLEIKALGIRDYKVEDNLEPDDFTIYMKTIRNHPVYSKRGQISLGIRMEEGDIEARNKLVISHLRFVARIALRIYSRFRLPVMQFIEWGNELLMDAVKNYDYRRNVSFTTYLRSILDRELYEKMHEFKKNVRLPSRTFYKVLKMREKINLFTAEHGRQPSLKELIHSMDWKEAEVRRVYNVYQFNRMSQEYANEFTVRRPSTAEEEYEKKELREEIERMLFYIKPVERRVIKLMYGFEGEELTFREIAKIIGVSHETARAYYRKAMDTLQKNPAAKWRLEAFLEGTRPA